MNNLHSFILEPYKTPSTRYTCPGCGKHKQFTRYINTATNEHLAPEVGKCNREVNCTYHYTPKQYFQDNKHLLPSPFSGEGLGVRLNGVGGVSLPATATAPATSYIPPHIFKQSLKSYEQNNLIHFLVNLFDDKTTTTLIEKYYIGTSKHWPGATIFWQIDITGKIRTGKIMLYNSETGKRIKKPYNHITWVHSLLIKNCHPEQSEGTPTPLLSLREGNKSSGLLSQLVHSPSKQSVPPQHSAPQTQHYKPCLFGEHLIQQHKSIPIAIVESEKTAIIASVYLPQFIWLACGSLNNLTAAKCQVLSGRNITLFPDLNCFEKWSVKAVELEKQITGTNFSISELLQQKATEEEKQNGFDLADFLIRFNPHDFDIVKEEVSVAPLCVPAYMQARGAGGVSSQQPKADWNTTIATLQTFFASATLPQSIQLNHHTFIKDVPKFIDAHLATIKSNSGNPFFDPYLIRLMELQSKLLN